MSLMSSSSPPPLPPLPAVTAGRFATPDVRALGWGTLSERVTPPFLAAAVLVLPFAVTVGSFVPPPGIFLAWPVRLVRVVGAGGFVAAVDAGTDALWEVRGAARTSLEVPFLVVP